MAGRYVELAREIVSISSSISEFQSAALTHMIAWPSLIGLSATSRSSGLECVLLL
jgi:hypothetical protein